MARELGVRRSPGVWRRLDVASRYAWPAGFLVLGLFVIGLPFGLPGQAEMRPAYGMACVFFWSLYRPSSLPAPVVALVGLLLDLLVFSPLGVWAVLLLLLQGATIASRRRLLPFAFPVIWLAFCGFAAVLSALAWAAQSLLYLHMLPSLPLAAQVLAAAGVYPALAGVFIRAHRGAAAAELA
jgi:rod shape-determining protein MreD